MKYLQKAFTRPFENISKFTTGSVTHLVLSVITTLVFVFILGGFFSSLGIDPLNPDVNQQIDLAESEVINIVIANLANIALGTILALATAIIIISLLQGYFLRCMRSAIKGKYTLPKWNKWGNMFKKGFILGIIYILYTLIGTASMILAFIPFLGWIISLAVMFLIFYNIPMIEVFYAKNYKFKEAFDIKGILKKTLTGKYLGNGVVILLAIILIAIIESLVSGLLTITIVLPMIIRAIVYVYTGIFFATAFGRLYTKIK